MQKNKIKGEEKQFTEKQAGIPISLPKIVSSFGFDNLLKNLPFFIFIFLLGIIYISNAHHCEKKIRAINKDTKELKELRWEYKSLKAELIYSTKENQIINLMRASGLKEMIEPPLVMEINKSNESSK